MAKAKNKKALPKQVKLNEEKYNSDKHPPRFSFRFLIKHNDFGFESLDNKHKTALANKMYRLSQMNWSMLRKDDRHGLGYEKINRKTLNFTLPDTVPSDTDIIAFRFHEKAPMLGYRSSFGTFYIIAFDSRFKAYNH